MYSFHSSLLILSPTCNLLWLLWCKRISPTETNPAPIITRQIPMPNKKNILGVEAFVQTHLHTVFVSVYLRPDRVRSTAVYATKSKQHTHTAYSINTQRTHTHTPCETKHCVAVHPGVLKIDTRRAVLEDDDLQLVIPPVGARANLINHTTNHGRGGRKGRSVGNVSMPALRNVRTPAWHFWSTAHDRGLQIAVWIDPRRQGRKTLCYP